MQPCQKPTTADDCKEGIGIKDQVPHPSNWGREEQLVAFWSTSDHQWYSFAQSLRGEKSVDEEMVEQEDPVLTTRYLGDSLPAG